MSFFQRGRQSNTYQRRNSRGKSVLPACSAALYSCGWSRDHHVVLDRGTLHVWDRSHICLETYLWFEPVMNCSAATLSLQLFRLLPTKFECCRDLGFLPHLWAWSAYSQRFFSAKSCLVLEVNFAGGCPCCQRDSEVCARVSRAHAGLFTVVLIAFGIACTHALPPAL